MSINGMLLRIGQSLAPVSFSALAAALGYAWGFYGGIGIALLLSILVFGVFKQKTGGPA